MFRFGRSSAGVGQQQGLEPGLCALGAAVSWPPACAETACGGGDGVSHPWLLGAACACCAATPQSLGVTGSEPPSRHAQGGGGAAWRGRGAGWRPSTRRSTTWASPASSASAPPSPRAPRRPSRSPRLPCWPLAAALLASRGCLAGLSRLRLARLAVSGSGRRLRGGRER